MTSTKDLCLKYFETANFYEVLQLAPSATPKAIKKAYHRLSLQVHPDRVSDAEKPAATEKFKVLARVHALLQDAERRRCYDACGEVDEESDSSFNWMEYWRLMFKKIEISDIRTYELAYIGSETELRDIRKAYEGGRGDMDLLLEMVAFSNCESEPRFLAIVRGMIDRGEVEEYAGFFDESPRKKERRRRIFDEEKKQAELIDLQELEEEINSNAEKRLKGFNKLIEEIEGTCKGKKRKSLTNGAKGSNKQKRKSNRT